MGRDLTRRRFLQLAASAAPAGPSLVGRLAEDGRSSAAPPVVVIGAGLAGLRAADVLRKAGRPVVVLEARERAGGRVVTIRAPFTDGLHAEAGPSRIASAHQAVLRAVRSFGLTLTLFESSQGSSVVAIRGKAATTAEVARGALALNLKPDEKALVPAALLDRSVGTLPDDLASATTAAVSWDRWRAYDRVTWPEWLRSRGASADAIRLMTLGGDSSDLSALYVLRQFAMLRRSTQRYKIQGGMDLLPRAMAESLGDIVRYDAPVVRVTRQSAGGRGLPASPNARFRVDYRSNARVQSLGASRVIFAIPFTTLRDIELRPRLSRQKERAIAQLPYYGSVRFLLQARSRFWNSAELNGSARTDRATETWDSTFDQTSTRRGILAVNTGGAMTQAVAGLTAAESVKIGIGLAADAFPAIGSQFEQGVVWPWASEPWSRGAFAVFGPGQMSALMPDIARPETGYILRASTPRPGPDGWREPCSPVNEPHARF